MLTYAVITSIDRPEMVCRLVDQLAPQIDDLLVFDNGYEHPPLADMRRVEGWPLHKMWNEGFDWAATLAAGDPHNTLMLNDDVMVAPDFVAQMVHGLRSAADNWVAYPDVYEAHKVASAGSAVVYDNPHMARQTMVGWAYMIRGETQLRIDEQFVWFYGESDLEMRVRQAGKRCICVAGAFAVHLDPNRRTLSEPLRLAKAQADETRYAAKWGIPLQELWLTANAEMLPVWSQQAQRV